jgi:hypothetical protein
LGTGFFLTADGLAVTNSHVVYPAMHDAKYTLAAVVGHEIFSIEVLCSSSLDYDPLKGRPLQYHKDIARIRLQPWTGADPAWANGHAKSGTVYTTHHGALPLFHSLELATGTPSGRVHSFGYGKVSAFIRLHRSEGTVSSTGSLSDGTPYFGLEMTQPAQPGDSGSPVLDDHDRVVGILTWGDYSDGRLRLAQGAVALQSCGR